MDLAIRAARLVVDQRRTVSVAGHSVLSRSPQNVRYIAYMRPPHAHNETSPKSYALAFVAASVGVPVFFMYQDKLNVDKGKVSNCKWTAF
jgi:hypothetical protein